METPLLLKIMLSWAIMIFCFTALFAGAHKANRENFNATENEEEKEMTTIKHSKGLQTDLKKLKLGFNSNKKNSNETIKKLYDGTSGGSALSATQRNKDSQ
jgi:hypothetical protein